MAPNALAGTYFTVADYTVLKSRDIETARLVLQAMREAVFFAQESVGGPVVCASPIPIPGARVMELLDKELGNPTNKSNKAYSQSDQVAFVLLYALKREGACR